MQCACSGQHRGRGVEGDLPPPPQKKPWAMPMPPSQFVFCFSVEKWRPFLLLVTILCPPPPLRSFPQLAPPPPSPIQNPGPTIVCVLLWGGERVFSLKWGLAYFTQFGVPWQCTCYITSSLHTNLNLPANWLEICKHQVKYFHAKI